MIRQTDMECPLNMDMTKPKKKKFVAEIGFTLIELLITIVVLAIFLTLAVPSFRDTIDKRRVVNATTALQSQLQQARSFSILLNRVVHVDISVTSPTNWCIGVTDKASCDCTADPTVAANAAAVCSIDQPDDGTGASSRINVIGSSAEYPGVGLAVPGAITALEFEPTRGILFAPNNAVTFEISSVAGTGRSTEISVNRLGKTSACASGEVLLGGIQQCQ